MSNLAIIYKRMTLFRNLFTSSLRHLKFYYSHSFNVNSVTPHLLPNNYFLISEHSFKICNYSGSFVRTT